MKHVRDGEAELRVVEVPMPEPRPTTLGSIGAAVIPPPTKRLVVNEQPEILESKLQSGEVKPVKGMKVQGAGIIKGPFIKIVKGTRGSVAKLKAEEGMWEVRRGIKVDGGERRKLQVRRKRLLESRKNTRAR